MVHHSNAALRTPRLSKTEQKMHLTDLAVRSLKPGYHWDDTTPGFGIRVGKQTKAWTIIRGTARERITIGRYPAIPLTVARKEARKLLCIEIEVKTEAPLFADAKTLFLDDHYRTRSARSKYEATRHLNKHFKTLHSRSLDTIEDAAIEKCFAKITAPSEKLHAYRFLRTFFRWCTRPPRRYLKHSPMEGYQPPSKDTKRKRTLKDQELRAVWQAADGPTNSIVRLLILWGTRSTETAVSEREWAPDDVMTIPGAHTKNGRDHAIPILPLARQVLSECTAGRYYFHSRWGNDHLSSGAWSKIKREIQVKSGTKDWQIRDLRRTFRTNLARLGVPRDLAEVMINHAPEELDEIYDQYSRIKEKRAALAKYERWLQTILKD